MNCHKTRTMLIPLLESDLSLKEKEKVEAHLRTCSACREEKDLLSRSWQILDSYATPKLTDDFVLSLMRRIHSEQIGAVKASYRFPRLSIRRLAPALAILLIILVIFFWKKGKDGLKPVTITPYAHQERVYVVTDDEIIRNLDIYENTELLENLDLLAELDVIKNIDEPALLR